MARTRRGTVTSLPKAKPAASKKKPAGQPAQSIDVTAEDDPALMKLRMAALEQALLLERASKKPGTGREPDSESSSSSSSESSSESSSSSSDDSGRSSKKSKSKRRKYKKSRPVASQRTWTHSTYQHQYDVNKRVLKLISKASKAKSSKDRRRHLSKGKGLVESRQEWLCVADRYGSGAASRYEEGGEWTEMFGESEKRRRLMAAIQPASSQGAVKKANSAPAAAQTQLPFPQRAPGSGSAWGGIKPSVPQGPTGASPQLQSRSAGACHRCGEIGHFIKFCPKGPQTPATR